MASEHEPDFTCTYCGEVLPYDDQAPDEDSKSCCWPCKYDMEAMP